jgi:TorA maturation chaperone TorD
VEAIRSFVPHSVVTHPLAPTDNLALYRLLGALFHRRAQAERLCATFETELRKTLAIVHHLLDRLLSRRASRTDAGDESHR